MTTALNTKVSGTSKEEKMDAEFKSGSMVLSMKVTGKMTKQTEGVV